MTDPAPQPVTQLLNAVSSGNETAHGQLWEIVYAELKSIARRQLGGAGEGRTLQPTALVNEAYLRLCHGDGIDWANRRHFFAVAAKIMRQVRIDSARRSNRQKRGGTKRPVSLDAPDESGQALAGIVADDNHDPAETLALDEALTHLEQIDPLKAELVMLRFHAGLTREQIAEMLGMAPRTVDKEWFFARSWMRRVLAGE